MKTNKFFMAIFLSGILCLLGVQPGQAQAWYAGAAYQISFPMGDTKDFTDATSFRGGGLDFRKSINPSTTVGFTFGWNVFYERTTETIEIKTEDPGAITGLQDRTINAFPIMVGVHKYFGREAGPRPFIGLNAGGYVMLQRFEIGLLTFQNDQWQWGVAPEIGIAIPTKSHTTLLITGKYNYAFTGESAVGSDVNNSYLSLGFGVAWRTD